MKNTHNFRFSIFKHLFLSVHPAALPPRLVADWSGGRRGRDLGRLLQCDRSADHSRLPSTHTWTETRAHMNRNARTRTHAHARSQCPLSVAGECPVKRRLWLIVRRLATCSRTNRNTSRPMRMYWKNTKVGSRSVRSALVRRERNQCMTVQLMSAPSSSAGILIQAVEKLSPFPAWHHN